MDSQDFIIRATAIVNDRIAQQQTVTVALLAVEMDIHPAHLYKKMKAALGVSPSDFIRTIRLEQATDFLTESDLTVKQIAFRVGFESSSYFILRFKEKYRTTPLKYRNNAR